MFFIDSDDLISTNALSEVDSCISKHMSDIVYFDYKKFHAEKDEPLPQFELSVPSNSIRKISNVILTKKPNFAWARVAKREMYIKNRFPVGFIYEDVLTSPLLSARARAVSYIEHELYGYRKRSNSITTGSAEKQFRLFETLRLLKENVIRENIDIKFYTTAFVNLIQSCLVSLVRIDDRKIRQKYIDLILTEYNKLSYRDILIVGHIENTKYYHYYQKIKSLFLLSAALRQIVVFSDKQR
ncbi:glycosyltransferase family 2 protein [Enterobacter cloacae]|uniref:glycosyltransferase family 2 protein n=1 Tax=Enterobacter cloacae TaxID=550 RepID=UPI00210B33CF|nr:glycosyltransferase family 2 protein [Enterobacter cloacae]MCQ4410360.1 glycosyltransferase family 2 protein [Enterobacter cloacae]